MVSTEDKAKINSIISNEILMTHFNYASDIPRNSWYIVKEFWESFGYRQNKMIESTKGTSSYTPPDQRKCMFCCSSNYNHVMFDSICPFKYCCSSCYQTIVQEEINPLNPDCNPASKGLFDIIKKNINTYYWVCATIEEFQELQLDHNVCSLCHGPLDIIPTIQDEFIPTWLKSSNISITHIRDTYHICHNQCRLSQIHGYYPKNNILYTEDDYQYMIQSFLPKIQEKVQWI